MQQYTRIQIDDEIYCSSSSDHFIAVSFTRSNRFRQQRNFWIDGGTIDGARDPVVNAPKYLITIIERHLLTLLLSGKFKVYEYTRDGDKRYDDLRYHDAEWFGHVIARLMKQYSDIKAEGDDH